MQHPLSGAGAPLAGVHVYAVRARADMNAARKGLQPHFVRRSAAQMSLDRLGTLNGHACGVHPKIIVAGAYRAADFPYRTAPGGAESPREHAADYSASGPTPGARLRPDVSIPVDDGVFLAGTMAMGTRSAAVFSMSGTSVAAPLAARLAANGFLMPYAKDVPAPPPDPALGTPVGRS